MVVFTACQSEPDSNTPAIITQVVPVVPTEATQSDTTEEFVEVIVTYQLSETLGLPTITSIPSPIPVLPLAEKEAIISELYRTNANCKLPCWWGIVPGETEWQTAKLLLNLVATELSTSAESEFDTYYSARVYLLVPQELSRRMELEQYYIINDGKVMIIEPEAPRVGSKIYTVSKILSTYGRPTKVMIDTYGYPHEGPNPFRLVLFYPDKGILVNYGDFADFVDGYVVGCIQIGNGSVVLWSPKQNLSFAEALNGTRGLGTFGEQYYKPLEEATEMDIETFYQTYLDPDTETCIETPAELWMDR